MQTDNAGRCIDPHVPAMDLDWYAIWCEETSNAFEASKLTLIHFLNDAIVRHVAQQQMRVYISLYVFKSTGFLPDT